MRIAAPLLLSLALFAAPVAAQDESRDGDNPGLREVPDDAGWQEPKEPEAEMNVQEPEPRAAAPRRPTFWISGGIGAAGLAVRMNEAAPAYSPRQTVPSLSLGFGASPDPHVQLGVELFSWFNFTGSETVESVVMVMLGARFHPVPGSGLFLRGSGGLGVYRLDWQDSWLEEWLGDDYCGCDAAIDTDLGLAWSVGAGYLAPVGRHLRLGPTVELLHMRVGGPAGYQQRIVNLGLTLTFDGND